MTDIIRTPARNPCGSCPYRRDVPSGVWDPEEYEKLPPYDAPTIEQPTSVFMCHQQDGRLCAGWVGCHDMNESFSIRLAAERLEDIGAVYDYTTTTPLFASGADAARHGLAEVEYPGKAAKHVIDKLNRRQGR